MESDKRPHSAGAYWQQLRERALGPPKGLLDWSETACGLVVPLVLFWRAFGRDRALEELAASALYVGGAVVVFTCFALLRIGRAAYEIHEDDLHKLDDCEKALTDATRKLIDGAELEEKTIRAARIETAKRLNEFLNRGRRLVQAIISEDERTFEYWRTPTESLLQELKQYLDATISPGRASHIVNADNHMAVHIPGVKGPDREAKIALIQKIRAVMDKLLETLAEY